MTAMLGQIRPMRRRNAMHFSNPFWALVRSVSFRTKLCWRWIVAMMATQWPNTGSETWKDLLSSRSRKYMIQPAWRVICSKDCCIKDCGMVRRKLRSRIERRKGWFSRHGIAA